MKKVFYNSWIAKNLLFSNYTTITLLAWVFTKYSKGEVRQSLINHECTHARQWVELTVASGLFLWIGLLLCDYSAWWLMLSGFTFYILYIIESFIRWVYSCFMSKEYSAYRNTSFEKEARLAENDPNYLENSRYFSWLKLIF